MTERSIVRRLLRVGVLFMLIGAMLTVVRAHPAGAATVCDNETGDVTVDLPGIGSVGVDPTLDPNAGVCTDLYGLGLGQLNLLVTSQDPNPSSLGNTVVLRECNGSGTCLILLSSTGAELGQLVPCNPTTGGGLCLHDTTVYVDGIPVTLSGYTGADASRVDLIPQVKTGPQILCVAGECVNSVTITMGTVSLYVNSPAGSPLLSIPLCIKIGPSAPAC